MRLPHQNENCQRACSHQQKTPSRTQETDAGVMTSTANSVDYSFPKSARILERAKFLKIMKTGTRVSGSSIVIFYRRKEVGLARLGITVSKKHGKAHDRNYFKRLVREAFRLCRPQLPTDIEINVQPAGKREDPRRPLSLPGMIDDFLYFSHKVRIR